MTREREREREREEVSGVTEHCLHYRKHVSVDSAGVTPGTCRGIGFFVSPLSCVLSRAQDCKQ